MLCFFCLFLEVLLFITLFHKFIYLRLLKEGAFIVIYT